MNFKSVLAILFATLCTMHGYGQGQKCLTSIKKAAALENNPELVNKMQQIEEINRRWISDYQNETSLKAVVTVPVVVHVIWREANENISDAQIMSQMEVLNNDFRKLNDNFNEGPAAFRPLGADIEIEFCMASIDPSGKATNGITRRKTTVDNIGETEDAWYQASEGGTDAWDVDQYINIWVCDIGDDGTLGFASPPGFADPEESDGLVVGHQYFGTIGTATDSWPNHLGRTTTHEMGHYFNLEHLWGIDGGCNDDDLVSDTPQQDEASYDCSDFPTYDACTSTGNGIMYNNYMDYSDDSCMTLFTKGQKDRMLAALNNQRKGLLTGNVCDGTNSILNLDQPTLHVFPNPARNVLHISINGHEHYLVKIYNGLGNMMQALDAGNDTEVDISGLSNGIYFISFDGNAQAPQKLIISK